MAEPTIEVEKAPEVPVNRPYKVPLRKIHDRPLPLQTFPLPSFYPSNPISLLHVAVAWLKQVFRPPANEPSIQLKGQWNPTSRSVHITDPEFIRILWEKGFWGKGNLSRSEPNWLKREQVRRGLVEGGVSEEFTVSRREDRQQLKWMRARAEQEAIERTRALELKAPVGPLELLALPNSAVELQLLPKTGLAKMKEALEAKKENGGPPEPKTLQPAMPAVPAVPATTENPIVPTEDIKDREHLQLTREEAFFLTFATGNLVVLDENSQAIPTEQLLALFRTQSYFPTKSPDLLSSDDPFLVNYAVYHHFRSLGWCTRPGIKFGVDWLLYLDGPVFNHGEFGLIIIPSFSDAKWKECPSRHQYPAKTWSWLMGTVRVLSHVYKSLVLVYVDIPPPPTFDSILQEKGIAQALAQYRIREVPVRRWSSNRNR